MWMKIIQQNLKSNNLSLNELSTLETAVYVRRYTPLVVHARNEDEQSISIQLSNC